MSPTSLAAIFTVAVLLALLFDRLRLPTVLAYVGTGVVVGPSALGWLSGQEHGLEIVAELGVMLLLFTVGLELSLRELARSWRAVLVGGALQVGLSCGMAVAIGTLAGLSWQEGLFWGYLVAMSSTAVVLRLLDARGETKAAHGRLVIGILLFQDLAVVPMMLSLPMLNGERVYVGEILRLLGTGALIVVTVMAASIWAVPRLLGWIARMRNRELFLLGVLAIGGLTAWLTSVAGLSLALGAFVAGVVLAETQYSHQALADVLPFRSVTMCVFFVSIGMLLDPAVLAQEPLRTAALLGAIVIGKFLVAFAVGAVLRFPVRVAALAAVALAQVGEFSFVLIGEGAAEGLIAQGDRQLFLAASVLSIATAPLIVAAFPRFLAGTHALDPLERLLDRGQIVLENEETRDREGHVVVAGLGVGGRTVVTALERAGLDVVIIELNPETVAEERRRGRSVVYGDVTAPEVLIHAGIGAARALVLVTSDLAASRRAADVARSLLPSLPVLLRVRFASEEGDERLGGFEVLSEEFAGARAMAALVLSRCGVPHWDDIVDQIANEHGSLPAGDEGSLGPTPPAAHRQEETIAS